MDKKVIIFDLDGTIYFGDKLANSAREVLQFCKEKFAHVFFITNNSAKTREEIYQKLLNMGLGIEIEQLITCGYTIARYLNKNNYQNVFTIGTESLKKELSNQDINPNSEMPQAIIVGYNRDFCLENLKPIVKYRDSDLKLIIANKEHSYPWNNNEILPGAGQIVVSVEYTLNKTFDVCIGKPNSMMLDIMLEGLNIHPNDVIVVGDSYESDIKMAQAYGAKGVLITQENQRDCVCIKELSELLEVIK